MAAAITPSTTTMARMINGSFDPFFFGVSSPLFSSSPFSLLDPVLLPSVLERLPESARAGSDDDRPSSASSGSEDRLLSTLSNSFTASAWGFD